MSQILKWHNNWWEVLAGRKALEKQSYCRHANILHPKLDTRISFVLLRPPSVMLVISPLKSEMGWTEELWSNCVLLILEK